MVAMVGFRNIVVHGYEVVDLNIVETHFDDLLAFVGPIRQHMQRWGCCALLSLRLLGHGIHVVLPAYSINEPSRYN